MSEISMKRLPFIFATRSDMLALDDDRLRRARLKYILAQPMETINGREFERLEEITGIGEVPTGKSRGGVSCLILPTDRKPHYRKIDRNDGSVVWVADETGNKDAVFLWSPGIYADKRTLIAGDIATSFETPVAQITMKVFNSALSKAFGKRGIKRGRVFVGPEALRLAMAGWRCAFDVGSPRESDVSIADSQ